MKIGLGFLNLYDYILILANGNNNGNFYIFTIISNRL